MSVKASKLKEPEVPQRTKLYEIRETRKIIVKEPLQEDGSRDEVVLEYCVENGCVGYFANEYRPDNVAKTGAKLIDITAVLVDNGRECIRWHLYDIKSTLAGGKTVEKVYNQWNFGLQYLQQNILEQVPAYSVVPDLGVITRCYDEKRMERLRDDCQKNCGEIETFRQGMALAQRKKRVNIAKYRGRLKAAQAILDRRFEAENGTDTYEIHIRKLIPADGQVYKMEFPV